MRAAVLAVVSCVVVHAILVDSASAQTPPAFSMRAIDHSKRGQRLLERERFAAAAAEFRTAVTLDPLLATAHYGLGQAHVALREYDRAIQSFAACRRAYLDLHALHARRDAEIVSDGGELRRAMEIDRRRDVPTTASLRRERDARESREPRLGMLQEIVPAEVALALGSAYFRSGDLAGAELEFRAATAIRPGFGEAHNNLAVVYAMTGRMDEARAEAAAAERHGFVVDQRFKAQLAGPR